MSEFIESSEQESPKGTETRESSVFEPPTYTISFNEDFTLNWEPAVGSMELAVALCYQFPLEQSLEDKMRAATKLFLKQNKKKLKTDSASDEIVVVNSTDQTPEDVLSVPSMTAVLLSENSNAAAVDDPENQVGMRIMKWNPELQGFSQKRSRRKLREDEAVQVAANRGYACEDHKRRKLKCDPNRCLQNGQNVASGISKSTKGKVRNPALPSQNEVASSVRGSGREQAIFETTSSSDPKSTHSNGQAVNISLKSVKPTMLDPMAPIFTPSSFPSSPFTLSPLSSTASSATLNLLAQSGNYQFDFANANIGSNADANSFGPSSYNSSVTAFDWQLPGQQYRLDLDSFDFSRTPDSSGNDTSAPTDPPDENDLSWDTWFNQLCDPPKDDISLTPPQSQRGNSISYGRTPEPYLTPPPYTQTRSVQSRQISSQEGLKDGIYCRSELPSRSGPQLHKERSYIQSYTFNTRSAIRSPQSQPASNNRSNFQSTFSSCRDLINERATHSSNFASESRRASEVPQTRIHPYGCSQNMSTPLSDDQPPLWVPKYRSSGGYTRNAMQWRNVPAYHIADADVQGLKVAQDIPWEGHDDILATDLERMMI